MSPDHAQADLPHQPSRRGRIPRSAVIVGVSAALVVTAWSPWTWVVLLDDLRAVVAVIAAAAGCGIWLHKGLRLDPSRPLWAFCTVTAFGLGVLAVIILSLGVTGFLTQYTAWGVVTCGILAGIVWLYVERGTRREGPTVTWAGACLWLPLALPLGCLVFAASVPPGTLWPEEARGYDVLEYHLQAQREYFEAGRIHFLPHNVYASFPQQVEILYLLLMHMKGSAHGAAVGAQLLHATLTVLTVLAVVGWWGNERRSALVSGLILGSVPWLAYVGCLAYVECGVLFFGAVASGLVLDSLHKDETQSWRLTLAAGLCAGFAGGCKYTALALVTVALAAAWLVTMRARPARRAVCAVVFSLGALVALSPWLIRNAVFTGNPVYPFAYAWFGGEVWSPEQDAQWAAGHAVQDGNFAARLHMAIDESLLSARFGPGIFLLALLGATAGTRRALLLTIWALLMFAAWATFTHVPGRFAVPLVVPLAYLCGDALRSCVLARGMPQRVALPALVVVTLGFSLYGGIRSWRVLAAEDASWRQREKISLAQVMVHGHSLYRRLHPLNQPEVIREDARLWLVGDAAVFYIDREFHYTVVFNRDPWIEYAAEATPKETVDWLRTENVTHVVFSWPEIARLRGSYGFPDLVTRTWVASLAPAGLVRCEPPPEAGPAAYEVYAVSEQ